MAQPDSPPSKYLPAVLAFRRGVIISDAPLEYETGNGQTKPVMVMLHGVMGTQNVNKKEGDNATSTVAEAARGVGNPQTIETAKMGPDAQRMIATFELKALRLRDALHSCATAKNQTQGQAKVMRDSLKNFVQQAEKSEGLAEVARRIARNICNGRWLWRNRLMASSIEITVTSAERTWTTSNALDLPLKDFNNYSSEEKDIGAVIAAGMRGDNPRAWLIVRACVDFGVKGSIEVYGSQNYEPRVRGKKGDQADGEDKDSQNTPSPVKDKTDDGLSRSLYKLSHPDMDPQLHIMGQAALRDAKVWNALRTIDTWYEDYAIQGMPIPVEPLGASLEMMTFFRAKNTSASAFDLFKKLNVIDPSSDDGMYCIASLMRGGVFSDSENKENREKPAKPKATEGAEMLET